MAFEEAKVYFDGSHYIAIPRTSRPTAKKRGGTKDTETDEKKKRKLRLWMVLILLIPIVAAITAVALVVTALMMYYG